MTMVLLCNLTRIGDQSSALSVLHHERAPIYLFSIPLVLQLAYCVVQFLEKDATLTDQVSTLYM